MITITVGNNKDYQSIQQAIDYIVSLGTLTDSIDVIVYAGVHGGFFIPPSGIGTSSLNTLTIKSAPNNKVILSGWNLSASNGHGHRMVGIGIGDNNSYIEIRGLIVENFHKGIVIAGNCTRVSIQSSILRMNTNVGIWIYRANYCSIVNSVILDSDFNLVLSEVDDVFIGNNDICKFTNPLGSSSGEKLVVYITTTVPEATSPPGSIVFYNNNIASAGQTLIGYGNNVLGKLRSNNNNLSSQGGLIAKHVNEASTIPDSLFLTDWQSTSNNDVNSISVLLPHYIGENVGSSLFTNIYTQNLPSFAGIAMGLPICNAPTASTASGNIPYGSIPSYVDTSLLCETVQSNFIETANNRPTIPAIGAYDSNYDVLGFGSSFAPIGSLGSGVNGSSCAGGSAQGIAVVEDRYSQSVECIKPAIKAGFFYVHDIQYYLYASKVGKYLADITVTEFVLARAAENEVTVYLDDRLLSEDNWSIKANILKLFHKDLDITDLDRGIKVIYKWKTWVVNGFVEKQITEEFRIRDGITRFILNDIPTNGSPIVITDDVIDYSDNANLLGREFTASWNEDYEKVEIKFSGPTNLILNPQFYYADTSYTGYLTGISNNATGYVNGPANWGIYSGTAGVLEKVISTTTGTTGVVSASGLYTGYAFDTYSTGSYDLYPVIGNQFCVLSGEIRQRIKINDNLPYWLSLYAAAIRNSGNINIAPDATGNVILNFYDLEMKALTGSCTGSIYVISDFEEFNSFSPWQRFSFKLANNDDDTLNLTGTYNRFYIPTGASYLDLCINSNTPLALDAICLHQSETLKPYNRYIFGYEATIEYDTGETDLYHVNDLTITPIRNRNTNGFLYIGAVPARQFDNDAPDNTTTLTDWYWPEGRINHLPWARTLDKNKLRYRANFNLEDAGINENVTLVPSIQYPEDIQVIPRVVVSSLENGKAEYEQLYYSGQVGVAGTDFTVKVYDSYGNPYAFEWIDINIFNRLGDQEVDDYVGLLGNREMGFYREFNNPISAQLDSAGATSIRWIPPSATDTMLEIVSPSNTFNTDEDGEQYIDLKRYQINEANHGNPFTSTVLSPNGVTLTGTSMIHSEVLGINSTHNGLKTYKLTHCPYRESAEVYVNHTGLLSATGTTQQMFDLRLRQSELPELSNGEYFIDEPKKLLFIKWNGTSNDEIGLANVRYLKREVYTKATQDDALLNRLYFSDDMVSYIYNNVSYFNPMAINYDIKIGMTIRAKSPIGMSAEYIYVDDELGQRYINSRDRIINTYMVGRCNQIRVGIDNAN